MAFDTIQTGFHFSVVFELLPQTPVDIQFQEVSGLNVEVEMEQRKEGGENRFVHQLPVRAKYGDVTLKRGKTLGSGVLHWARQATEQFNFKPVNLMVSLLDANHLPLYNWYLINAIPKRLEVSSFNAERSELVIETLTLTYQYYQYFDPAAAALDAAAALSGSVSVGIG